MHRCAQKTHKQDSRCSPGMHRLCKILILLFYVALHKDLGEEWQEKWGEGEIRMPLLCVLRGLFLLGSRRLSGKYVNLWLHVPSIPKTTPTCWGAQAVAWTSGYKRGCSIAQNLVLVGSTKAKLKRGSVILSPRCYCFWRHEAFMVKKTSRKSLCIQVAQGT